MPTNYSTTIACLLGVVLMLSSLVVLAVPDSELWDKWSANDATSTQVIDHAVWNDLLGKYIVDKNGLNLFRYGAVSSQDKAALKGYIRSLEKTPISQYNRDEQRAYWVNLYNALTIRVVLDHWPVDSILDIGISPGLFSKGPWGKKLLSIEDEAVSLDDIEHRILRPIWNDPRTHYSVNCASMGCPNLAVEAFTAENMERLLEDGARAFINHPRGVKANNGKLVVSSIYVWFKSDFGGNDQSVIEHLRRYADADLVKALAGISKIASDQYDWSVNKAP